MTNTDLHSLCYFQGSTVISVAADIAEYGDTTARLFLLTDNHVLAHLIQAAQAEGAKLYVQVKAEHGNEGGDPFDNAHICPGSPNC